MALYTCVCISPGGTRKRLDEVLFELLPVELAGQGPPGTLSRAKIRRLILERQVSVDGRTVDVPGLSVKPGSRLTVRVDPERLFREKSAGDIPYTADERCIVFEDDHILVANKPAGLPVDGTIVAGRDSFLSLLRSYVQSRDGRPGAALVLQHRLDRDTSGLVLFSKREDVNKKIHEQFSQRLVRKRYLALCAPGGQATGGQAREPWSPPALSVLPDAFAVRNCLRRLSPQSRAAFWGSAEDGLEASTDFRTLGRFRGACLVEARPHTGRTHQIRVHLSESGWPILGDVLYGGAVRIDGDQVPRCMLHAAGLELVHPFLGTELRLAVDPPADFRALLRVLEKTV